MSAPQDLIARLRADKELVPIGAGAYVEGTCPLSAEAAAEIERLRAALTELEEQLESAVGSPYVERLREIIRLALAGRPLSERRHDAERAL